MHLLELIMTFSLCTKSSDFLITDSIMSGIPCTENFDSIEGDRYYLFGYCFLETEVVKNGEISREQYEEIETHRNTISGIFSAVSLVAGKITVITDPLVQYGIYYYVSDDTLSISNSIFLISQVHGLTAPEDRYMFDSLAYQSPLRGLTVVKDVFAVQYDDLLHSDGVENYKTPLPLTRRNVEVLVPDSDVYSEMSYGKLLETYILGLNKRAKILAKMYDEVHITLTGGADSRLVLSSLIEFDNVFGYCYGDGSSANRIYFENISSAFGVKKSEKMIFCGRPLSSPPLIFKALNDTNCRKFNNLNLYMNADKFMYEDKCQVTGYYGANISGGVVLPPADTASNARISKIDGENFSYHDYVEIMKNRHSGLRRAAFNDMFYINNRGQSHYAAHSIANNLKCNSFDILYDAINLELVKKCPYEDLDVDKNAISIDLIHMNNEDLALFPYDDRKIPRYRKFDNVPILNCFDGLKFASENIPTIGTLPVSVDLQDYELLEAGGEGLSISEMLSSEEVGRVFEEYECLKYLKSDGSITASILLYYIYATILVIRSAERWNDIDFPNGKRLQIDVIE